MKFKVFKSSVIAGCLMAGFMSSPSQADVREIRHMNQILASIRTDTLLVFDIDNTLLEPLQTLGSDQWFRNNVTVFQQQGADENSAKYKAMLEWYQVNLRIPAHAVEPTTPALIRALQQHGVHVMGLTNRPARALNLTLNQFHSNGLDFTIRPPVDHTLKIEAGNVPGTYIDGILFISPFGDKGQFLTTFLKLNNLKPGNIVFVDDRPNNTQSVDAALTGLPVPHVEYRYGFDDAKVAAFRPDVGDLEWKIFGQSGNVINDQTALKILGRVE